MVRDKNWIQTASGNRFFFDAAWIQMYAFDIGEIAHALAYQARYGGHLKGHYSVAEHCVHMSRECERRLGKVNKRHAARVALATLLHDAAEAYLGDVSRPLKEHLPQYKDWEQKVERSLFQWFEVTIDSTNPLIKQLDLEMLEHETRWGFGDVLFWIGLYPKPAKGWRNPVRGWSARKAKREYLKQFRKLHRVLYPGVVF